ncbi:TetR/AcrR family transcriptional regulator C-terminal domain-containing protein [Amycolatopsis thermalba]|uniref:TetR/AcrR family transcriptional regulator C-terminal domain-containing protein n=1 Tax=Amycolatopsis thermalba TaxID=944492 RepID=A0ABY4NSB0_9PSEU|nr:TetR/AcrR family transcriptional regulator C-terminal domain-containing protein [Amycolatopsis thermalba]UQS22943.1 TetR/AcrR family transcriptional regulator C-terminal domain-containing protein [Amycolatopsis thermalba]
MSSERRAWGSLEREQIVAAAVALARREGLDALTIRRLAAEVGASRMALYRHVPDKEALLGLVADAIAADHVRPAEAGDGPWPDRLRALAHGMRRELRAYPGFAELIMTRSNHGPGGLRLAETIAEILAAAGLDEPAQARFYLVFLDVVLGRAHREVHGDPTTPERNARIFEAAQAGSAAPTLKALVPHLRAATADEVFDTELDMLVGAIHAARRQ